jgi:prevent-host-death family protein
VVKTVKVHEAKTHFSRLLTLVEGGDEVVVKRGDKPVARIIPYQERAEVRTPGRWRGRIWIADDFDEIPPEFDEYLV